MKFHPLTKMHNLPFSAVCRDFCQLSFNRFQVISEHTREGLIYDQTYLGIARTDAVIFIQITLSAGRKPAQKRALYARITELLTREPGVRAQDIVINLIEVAWENWSFGDGEAQYTQ